MNWKYVRSSIEIRYSINSTCRISSRLSDRGNRVHAQMKNGTRLKEPIQGLRTRRIPIWSHTQRKKTGREISLRLVTLSLSTEIKKLVFQNTVEMNRHEGPRKTNRNTEFEGRERFVRSNKCESLEIPDAKDQVNSLTSLFVKWKLGLME